MQSFIEIELVILKKVSKEFHFCPQPQDQKSGQNPRPKWVKYELYLH